MIASEGMSPAMPNFWSDKRVLITGHTGFKGAWLSLWLLKLGARVTGVSLPPRTDPALFDQLGLAVELDHRLGDICRFEFLDDVLRSVRPDVVFHLAARTTVRTSYREPLETWRTNVFGTLHLLESMRALDWPCVAVLVTTDKCYENREWDYGYRENDPLGGHDPYSASKAAAELAIASWRRSFFTAASSSGAECPAVASARAGNAIGGGDWGRDRIVPDAVRALRSGRAIPVRHPQARRPWQHVLEPVGAYLLLAEKLYGGCGDGRLATAFNFGPPPGSHQPVWRLVEEILKHWPGSWRQCADPGGPHEAGRLSLVTHKAFHLLGWQPRWDFSEAVRRTVEWYRSVPTVDRAGLRELSLAQIEAYEAGSVT